MAIGIIDANALYRAIELEVKDAVRRELDLLAEDACNVLRKKIAGQADALALKLLRQYDLETGTDRLIITVKKDK